MQKINTKKLTKEQMARMLETAYEANENANAELERTAGQIHGQQEEIAALRAELDKARAQYKAADQYAAALKAQIEVMDAGLAEGKRTLDGLRTQLEKTERTLGERETEIGEVKTQLVAAEAATRKKDELLDEAIHRMKMEKKIKETYHESWEWCMAHPWRNLWRCMKEYFFA